jgi:hypothetical protein
MGTGLTLRGDAYGNGGNGSGIGGIYLPELKSTVDRSTPLQRTLENRATQQARESHAKLQQAISAFKIAHTPANHSRMSMAHRELEAQLSRTQSNFGGPLVLGNRAGEYGVSHGVSEAAQATLRVAGELLAIHQPGKVTFDGPAGYAGRPSRDPNEWTTTLTIRHARQNEIVNGKIVNRSKGYVVTRATLTAPNRAGAATREEPLKLDLPIKNLSIAQAQNIVQAQDIARHKLNTGQWSAESLMARSTLDENAKVATMDSTHKLLYAFAIAWKNALPAARAQLRELLTPQGMGQMALIAGLQMVPVANVLVDLWFFGTTVKDVAPQVLDFAKALWYASQAKTSTELQAAGEQMAPLIATGLTILPMIAAGNVSGAVVKTGVKKVVKPVATHVAKKTGATEAINKAKKSVVENHPEAVNRVKGTHKKVREVVLNTANHPLGKHLPGVATAAGNFRPDKAKLTPKEQAFIQQTRGVLAALDRARIKYNANPSPANKEALRLAWTNAVNHKFNTNWAAADRNQYVANLMSQHDGKAIRKTLQVPERNSGHAHPPSAASRSNTAATKKEASEKTTASKAPPSLTKLHLADLDAHPTHPMVGVLAELETRELMQAFKGVKNGVSMQVEGGINMHPVSITKKPTKQGLVLEVKVTLNGKDFSYTARYNVNAKLFVDADLPTAVKNKRAGPQVTSPTASQSTQVTPPVNGVVAWTLHDTDAFASPGGYLGASGVGVTSLTAMKQRVKAMRESLGASKALGAADKRALSQIEWRNAVKETLTQLDSLVTGRNAPPSDWGGRVQHSQRRLDALKAQGARQGWSRDVQRLGGYVDGTLARQLTDAQARNGAQTPDMTGMLGKGGGAPSPTGIAEIIKKHESISTANIPFSSQEKLNFLINDVNALTKIADLDALVNGLKKSATPELSELANQDGFKAAVADKRAQLRSPVQVKIGIERPRNYDLRKYPVAKMYAFLRDLERRDPKKIYSADQRLSRLLVALKSLGTDTLSLEEMNVLLGVSMHSGDLQLGHRENRNPQYLDRFLNPSFIVDAKAKPGTWNPSADVHDLHLFLFGFSRVPSRHPNNSQPGMGGEGGLFADLTTEFGAHVKELRSPNKLLRHPRLKDALVGQFKLMHAKNPKDLATDFRSLQSSSPEEVRTFFINNVLKEGHATNPAYAKELMPLLQKVQTSAANTPQREAAIRELSAKYSEFEKVLELPSLRAMTEELKLLEATMLYGAQTGFIRTDGKPPVGEQGLFNFAKFKQFFNEQNAKGELVAEGQVKAWLHEAGIKHRD